MGIGSSVYARRHGARFFRPLMFPLMRMCLPEMTSWHEYRLTCGIDTDRMFSGLTWAIRLPQLISLDINADSHGAWCFAGIVAIGPQEKASRHYASMIVDGDDLHVLSRSGDERANNAHDGNLITFHTIRDFRRLIY